MRPKILIPLLFLIQFSFAQQPLTIEQINRLADAGKVYGYIKYFHPFLQYKNINWDSIFAANAESIINATNKEEYTKAMQQLLAPLNDDMTTVVNANTGNKYLLQPTAYSINDSILYISLNDITDESYNKVQEALSKITEVKGIVFDMRKPANSNHNYFSSGTVLDWWSNGIYIGDIVMPSFRSITYDYLPGAKMSDVTGANFKESTLYIAHGSAVKELPMVFVAGNADEIPSFAISLQQKGKAAIISPQDKQLIIGEETSFYINDSLLIKMRLSEGVNADGSLTIVYPDATYLSSDQGQALIKAKELIAKGFKKQSVPFANAPLLIYHSSRYSDTNNYPSLGYRVLAAAKIFSTVDHFFPFKSLMDKNWETCYKSNLSKFILAKDSLEFMRAVAELYANIQDSHGFITISQDGFSLKLNPIIQGRGRFVPPVTTHVIENKVVVNGIYNDSVCKKIGLAIGDIILTVDGENPLELIESARKYQCASTRTNQTFFLSNFILFGKEGEVKNLKVLRRDGIIANIKMPTLTKFDGAWGNDPYWLKVITRHNNPSYKLISKEIGYADLTSGMQQKDFDSIFQLFKGTKAIIFDLRGYPRYDGNPFKNLLQKSYALMAKFRMMKPSSPNIETEANREMTKTETTQSNFQRSVGWALPGSAVYPGKIVVLLNESNQSAAEHTCLVLKAICNATFIGSPTSGTDGVIAEFDIPGNLVLWFTGIEASFPDGTRIQRVGIQPDIIVYPSIKGIQSGKDEVLDRAIKYLKTGK